MGKQAFRLKLPTKWNIYEVFGMLLLEQDIIRKKGINQTNQAMPKPKNFEIGDNKEYQVKTIIDSVVYG